MKTCSKCSVVKGLVEFYADARKSDQKRAECKACTRAGMAGKSSGRDPEKQAQHCRAYKLRNRAAIAAATKARYHSNIDVARDVARRAAAKKSVLLTDTFVKHRLVEHWPMLRAGNIPPELIEAKREHLRVVRLLKEKRK